MVTPGRHLQLSHNSCPELLAHRFTFHECNLASAAADCEYIPSDRCACKQLLVGHANRAQHPCCLVLSRHRRHHDEEEEEEDEEADDSHSDIDDTRFSGMNVVPIEGAEYSDSALVTKRLSTGQDVVIGHEVWEQHTKAKLSTLPGLSYPTYMASVAGHDVLLCATEGTVQLRSLPDGLPLADLSLPGLSDGGEHSWDKEKIKGLAASLHQPQALVLTKQKVFLVTVKFDSAAPTLHAQLCIDLEQHAEFGSKFPSDPEHSYLGRFGPAVLWHQNDGVPVAVLASCDKQATIYFVKLDRPCTVDRAIVMHKRRPGGWGGKASVGSMKVYVPDPCDRTQDMLVSVGSDGKLRTAPMADAKGAASWLVTKTNTTSCNGLAVCSALHMAYTQEANRGMWWDLSTGQPIFKQEPLGEEYRAGRFAAFCCEFTPDDTGTVVFTNSNDCEAPTMVVLQPVLSAADDDDGNA